MTCSLFFQCLQFLQIKLSYWVVICCQRLCGAEGEPGGVRPWAKLLVLTTLASCPMKTPLSPGHRWHRSEDTWGPSVNVTYFYCGRCWLNIDTGHFQVSWWIHRLLYTIIMQPLSEAFIMYEPTTSLIQWSTASGSPLMLRRPCHHYLAWFFLLGVHFSTA